MTAKELRKLVGFNKTKTKYNIGDCFQVNKHTLAVCETAKLVLELGQYWILVEYDEDNDDCYLMTYIENNRMAGEMWFGKKELDSFTKLD